MEASVPLEQLVQLARTITADSLMPAVNDYASPPQVAAAVLGIMLGATIDASKQGDDPAYYAATLEAANAMLAPGYLIAPRS
jgi:hypothetical protein